MYGRFKEGNIVKLKRSAIKHMVPMLQRYKKERFRIIKSFDFGNGITKIQIRSGFGASFFVNPDHIELEIQRETVSLKFLKFLESYFF